MVILHPTERTLDRAQRFKVRIVFLDFGDHVYHVMPRLFQCEVGHIWIGWDIVLRLIV